MIQLENHWFITAAAAIFTMSTVVIRFSFIFMFTMVTLAAIGCRFTVGLCLLCLPLLLSLHRLHLLICHVCLVTMSTAVNLGHHGYLVYYGYRGFHGYLSYFGYFDCLRHDYHVYLPYRGSQPMSWGVAPVRFCIRLW